MTTTLEPMPLELLDLLAVGDLAAAGRRLGRPVPPDFADGQWVWQHFATLIREEPATAWARARYLVVDDGRVVGHAGLHSPAGREVQAGWHVDAVVRGRGIATAAAVALVQAAASRPELDRVVALIAPTNTASICVAEKAGYRDDGEQRHRFGWLMRRFVRDLL